MNEVICRVLIIIAIVVGVVLMLNRKDKNIESEVIIKHASMDDIVQIMNENKNYILSYLQ